MRRIISICILLSVIMCTFCTLAEDVWVLCQPDSFVNVRISANKHAETVGRADVCMKFETDKKTKKGFLHLINVPLEANEAWISNGYVTYTEPYLVMAQANIVSNGRVACWRSIGGTRRCWVKQGDIVTVYYVSEEWCVTNKGFIKTQYLGVRYENFSEFQKETELHFD